MSNTPQFTDTFDDYTDTPNPGPGVDYLAEARQITWAEANRRLTEAAALVPILEELGETTRSARAVLAQAETNENHTRAKYNGLYGTGQAMKTSIIKLCEVEGAPIPQDAPPAAASGTGYPGPYAEPTAERPLGGES